MAKDANCTKTRRRNRGLSTVLGSVLFLILIASISSALLISLSRYNDSVQQATNTAVTRTQEQIVLSNLTISDGYVTHVRIDNIGSITSQIKALYVDSVFVCDPSNSTLNTNRAYINSQDSQLIRIEPVEYNPTAYITVATARGIKAIEQESHLVGGSNSSFGAMDTNYGPLRLNFELFYYRETDKAGIPIGPWQQGSNVSINTVYCAWNITVTNIDIRNITLSQYSSLTLVPNSGGAQFPWYINNTSLFIQSNKTYTIVYVWTNPLPCTAAQSFTGFSSTTAKVFLTCYGNFSDGNTYGQTIPFEAVAIVKNNPIISTPTFTPVSPVPFGTPVRVTTIVSGAYQTPSGSVDFQVSTDGGTTFIKFGATKTLSSGTATSDPYIAQSIGNYQFRAVYLGDKNYFGATSSPTTLTVFQGPSTTIITLSPSYVAVNQPVNAIATVTPTGATGTVMFQFSEDYGLTFSQLGSNKTLTAGQATSDQYTPTVPGDNYQFRAIYSGDNNLFPSNSSNVTLTAFGPLNHFDLNTINTQTASLPFSITITAKDINEFTVTDFTGSASITDTTGTLSPITTGPFVAGTRTISISILRTGSGITISAFGSGATGISNPFTVLPNTLDHFAFNTITNQVAGTSFTITITAQDAYGNTVTTYSGINTLNDLSNSINPTSTGAFSNGVWTGSIIITNANPADTISTYGNGRSGTSNTFIVA